MVMDLIASTWITGAGMGAAAVFEGGDSVDELQQCQADPGWHLVFPRMVCGHHVLIVCPKKDLLSDAADIFLFHSLILSSHYYYHNSGVKIQFYKIKMWLKKPCVAAGTKKSKALASGLVFSCWILQASLLISLNIQIKNIFFVDNLAFLLIFHCTWRDLWHYCDGWSCHWTKSFEAFAVQPYVFWFLPVAAQ